MDDRDLHQQDSRVDIMTEDGSGGGGGSSGPASAVSGDAHVVSSASPVDSLSPTAAKDDHHQSTSTTTLTTMTDRSRGGAGAGDHNRPLSLNDGTSIITHTNAPRPPLLPDASSDPSTSSASSTNTISLAGPSNSSSLASMALHHLHPQDSSSRGGSNNNNNHNNIYPSSHLPSRSHSHQSAATTTSSAQLHSSTAAAAAATERRHVSQPLGPSSSSSPHLHPLRISTRPSNKRASSYSPGLVLSPSQFSAPPHHLSYSSTATSAASASLATGGSQVGRSMRNSLDDSFSAAAAGGGGGEATSRNRLTAPASIAQASSISLPLSNDELLCRQQPSDFAGASQHAHAHPHAHAQPQMVYAAQPASSTLASFLSPEDYFDAPLNQRLRALELERPSSTAYTSTNTSPGGSWTASSSASGSPFLPNANTARAYQYAARSTQRGANAAVAATVAAAAAAAASPSATQSGDANSLNASSGPTSSALAQFGDGYEAEREQDPDTSPSNPSQPSSYISQLEAEIHSSLNPSYLTSPSASAQTSSSRLSSVAGHPHHHHHHQSSTGNGTAPLPQTPASPRTQAQSEKGKGRSRQTSASSGDHRPLVRDFALDDQTDLDLETTDLASDAGGNVPWDVRETDRLRSAKDPSTGRRMINQYARVAELGKGVHGRVWLCEDTETGEFFAIKSVNREDRRNKSLKRSQAEAQARARQEAAEQREAELRRKQNPNASFDEEMQLNDDDGDENTAAAAEEAALARKQSNIERRTMMMDEKVKQEIAIMKRIHHPNVVQLREVIDDIRSKKIFMVLEYMPGGQIEWSREDEPVMTVDETRCVFRDVVLGLEYLHFNGIIHRDIKPANLLWTLDRRTAKISDFGVSHVSEALARSSAADPSGGRVEMTDDRALRKTEGSPAFFAPELCSAFESTPVATPIHELGRTSSRPDYFRRISTMSGGERPGSGSSGKLSPISPILPHERPNSKQRHSTATLTTISRPLSIQQQQAHKVRQPERPIVGKGIDVWALGVTLYCLLFGRTPFHEAKTEYELYNMIPKKEIAIPPKMGSDRLLTGTGMSPEVLEKDQIYVEGRLVVDLLSRLLEKDPTKRIELWQVKQHPWVLRNLENSQGWLQEHDLGRQGVVQVTQEEVQQATAQRTKPQSSASGLKAALKRFGETFGFGGHALKRSNTLRDRRPSVSSTSASITTASAWEGRSDASRAASRQASIVKKKPSNTSTLTAPADEMPPPIEGQEMDTNLLSHAMALKRKLTNAKAAQVAHEAATLEGNVSISSSSPPEEMPTKPHEHYRTSFLHQHLLSRSLSGDSSNDPKRHEPKPTSGRRQSVGHLLPPNNHLQRRVSSGAGSDASGASAAFASPVSPGGRTGRQGSAGKGSSSTDKDAEGHLGGSFRRMWSKIRSGSRTPAAASAMSPSRPVTSRQLPDGSAIANDTPSERAHATAPAVHSPGSTRRASAEYVIFSPTTSNSRPSSQDTDVDARSGPVTAAAVQAKESEAVPSIGQIAANSMHRSTVAEPGSDSSESLSDFDEDEDAHLGNEAMSPADSAHNGDISQPSSYGQHGGPVLWASAAEGWKFNPEIPADPLGRFLRQQQHRPASESENSDTPSPGLERGTAHTQSQSEPPRTTASADHSPAHSGTPEPVETDMGRRPLFKSDYIPPSSPYPEVKRKPTLSRDGSIQKDLKTKPPPPSPARLTVLGHAADDVDDDDEEEEVMIKPKSRFRRATNSSASASAPPSARPSLPASPKTSYHGHIVSP